MAVVFILRTGTSIFEADSSAIEEIAITFKTVYGESEEIPDPEITVSGTGYSLGGVQFRTEYDNRKPGKKVRTEIMASADSGKISPTSLNRSQCKVTGADFVLAKALDDTILQVKVDYKSVTTLGAIEKAGWNSSPKKKAVWKPVDYALGYMLILYRDSRVVKRLTMESSSVSLPDYVEDMDKIYYYEVEAVSTTSEQKEYLKEGAYVISTDQEFDWEDYERGEKRSSGSGDRDSIKEDSYIMPDGNRVSDTWGMALGKQYYSGGNSSRVKGWLGYGGRQCYVNWNGIIYTGWVNTGNGS